MDRRATTKQIGETATETGNFKIGRWAIQAQAHIKGLQDQIKALQDHVHARYQPYTVWVTEPIGEIPTKTGNIKMIIQKYDMPLTVVLSNNRSR
jgi:hypothetical protein